VRDWRAIFLKDANPFGTTQEGEEEGREVKGQAQERVLRQAPHPSLEFFPMPKSASPKIALAPLENIPLDQLEIHEDNVRKCAGDELGIEDLAADIAVRGLLQSLSVRPILNGTGSETGRYGVQAGSRRFRALKLLVKQKKLAKNAPIACIVKRDGYVEADSLAENTQRQALKPLDEFCAFKAMADKGHGEETIAAAFRVSTLVVRQRMRLANANPAVLKAYEDDEISLEQLMAFCLSDNHARQEQVFEAQWPGRKGLEQSSRPSSWRCSPQMRSCSKPAAIMARI
jgi:ParB family transcriptional regulator, chromosome partitioning protein